MNVKLKGHRALLKLQTIPANPYHVFDLVE
jgi:hypothetical protein